MSSLTFSPDGRILAVSYTRRETPYGVIGGRIAGETWLYNARSGQVLKKLPGAAGKLFFAPQGDRLICGTDAGIQVWNFKTGEFEATLLRSTSKRKTNEIVSLAYLPESHVIAGVSGDGTVAFWNVRTRQLLNTFAAGLPSIQVLAFSPDGRTLATGGADKTIQLWKVSLVGRDIGLK